VPTVEDIKKQREDTIAELEKVYALSNDDATAMLTEPEKVIPKLAARLYVDAYEGVMQAVSKVLPSLVHQVQASSSAAEANQRAFFEKWPALQKPEYDETLRKIGVAWRTMNPKADPETAVQEIGALAMGLLKLTPSEAPAATPTPKPYVPAAPGGSVPSGPPKPTSDDAWWEEESM
jgi:hypothetical protein